MCSWQEGALFSLSLSRSSQPSRFKFLVHVHRWKKERKLTRFFLFRRRRRRGRRVASEGRIGRGRRRRRRGKRRREEEREGKGGEGTRNIERRKIHPRSPRRKRIKRGRWVIVVGASFHWESWEIPAIWCRRTPCPRYVIDDKVSLVSFPLLFRFFAPGLFHYPTFDRRHERRTLCRFPVEKNQNFGRQFRNESR